MADKKKLDRIISLDENRFVDENGSAYIPSYFTLEETKHLAPVTRNYQDPAFDSLQNSVKKKLSYSSSVDYSYVLSGMSSLDLLIIEFIGSFSSVQGIHVHRQCELFQRKLELDGIKLSDRRIARSLKKLEDNGLILKNNFEASHTEQGTDPDGIRRVMCYTLDVNGFWFLKNFFASSLYAHNPDSMFLKKKRDSYTHLRCWECVDVYQFFQSLPAFRGYNTSFSGLKQELPQPGGPLVYSPLQLSLQVAHGKGATGILNFVCYPYIQIDGVSFYKDVVDKWINWVYTDDEGNKLKQPNVKKEIPRLLPGINSLAIIVPDEESATYLNSNLKLYEKTSIPITFIVLERIQNKGVLHALLLPSEQHYDEKSNTYVGKLKEWKLSALLKED